LLRVPLGAKAGTLFCSSKVLLGRAPPRAGAGGATFCGSAGSTGAPQKVLQLSQFGAGGAADGASCLTGL